MTTRPTVEFFYCGSCPWTYLAFVRLNEAAVRTGANVVYRPVLADWIRPDVSRPSPLASTDAVVAAYARKDLQDWARFCGVAISLPQPWPVRPEWAQRGAVAAIEAGLGKAYVEEMFRAHFAGGRNIAERGVVLDVATDCGLVRATFESRLAAGDLLDTVQDNTEELVRRGGFASPTMFMGDDMYFGHERVSLLESALMRSAERPFIAPGEHGR